MGYFATVFVAVAAACICIAASESQRNVRVPFLPQDEPPIYVDSWAVKVEGGLEVADTLAAKYGFINKGQVSIRALQGLFPQNFLNSGSQS